MKIVYATGESYPFFIGGEDSYVSYSLPREISKLKESDVRVIMPKYKQIPKFFTEKFKKIGSGVVKLSWRTIEFEVETYEYNGIKYYFISSEYYFYRDKPFSGLDNCEIFSFFSKAVLESLEIIKFKPDIIQCTGLISSLIPLYLNLKKESGESRFKNLKTIFSFENGKSLGVERIGVLEDVIGIPLKKYSKEEELGFYDSISLLKGGVLYSDITIISDENYYKNVMKKDSSEELSKFFRHYKRKIYSIKNGVSQELFNPDTDEKIENNYTYKSIENRKLNKIKLQEELKLKVSDEIPMLAIIGKLDGQNGMEIIKKQFDNIMAEIVEVVVIGDGEERYEDFFDYYSRIFPDKVYSQGVEYSDDTLVRKIISSADLLLLPCKDGDSSNIEIIGKKYGIYPVKNDGINLSSNSEKFFKRIKETLHLYSTNKVEFSGILTLGMKIRNDWKSGSKKYLEIYEKLKG